MVRSEWANDLPTCHAGSPDWRQEGGVNVQTKPFNAYSAWQRECERNDQLWNALQRSLALLEMECDRRKLRGEDVSAIEDFIARTKKENPA